MQGESLDPTLRVMGGRSRYQLLQLLFINMGVWGAAFQLLDNIFIGRKVEWQQCAAPGNSSSSSIAAHLRQVDWTSEHVIYGACEITVTSDYQNQTYPCLFGYEYNYPRELSFRTEFDLVCGRSLLADLLQTLVIMGQAFGAFFACMLSDRYGRKGVLVWSQMGLLGVGMAIGVAPTYPLLASLKFAVGCLQQGVMTGKATMSIELFPSEFRSMTSLMMALMWMTGTCTMAVTSFLLQDYSWRCLQCVLSAVSLIGFLQLWYIDESLRWLMANGKKDAAIRVLERAARINRQDVSIVMKALCGDVTSHDVSGDLEATPLTCRPPPSRKTKDPTAPTAISKLTKKRERLKKRKSKSFDEDWELVGPPEDRHKGDDPPLGEKGGEVVEEGERGEVQGGGGGGGGGGVAGHQHGMARELVGDQKPFQKLTLLDIFKHRRLRLYTGLVWATWFTCTFSAYSLYVMSTSLHGNRFLNFFLTASMKLPSGLLFFYMVDRAGRKAGIQLFFLLAAVGLLTSAVFRAFEDNSLFAILSLPASLIGAMGATGNFGALFLYTPELYPTNIRQQALGYASVVGRLGGMLAPFMIPLSEAVVWAPGVLTGSMCLGVIFLFRFLPETQGRELPQTLEDVDKWDTTDEGAHGVSSRLLQGMSLPSCVRFVHKLSHSVFALCVRFSQVIFPRKIRDANVLIV